jgi:5,10-methenyltetrahydrofolate synthetase
LLPKPVNPMPAQYESKLVWRAWAKAQRSFVCSSFTKKTNFEQSMVHHLKWLIENSGIPLKSVGIYAPLPCEPNLLLLPSFFPSLKWVFPRMGSTALGESETQLYFHSIPENSQLTSNYTEDLERLGFVQNAWCIWEPPPCWASSTSLDLLIIPALAMDKQGVRLGYGGGYYDRWLSTVPIKPLTIGVCWQACKVETLPKEVFDIPLNGTCTEQGILLCT